MPVDGAAVADPRADVASLLIENEEMIRRHIRLRLPTSLQRVFDSADVFSTIVRRVDDKIVSGRFDFRGERELMAFVMKMLTHVVIDRIRIIRRIERAESEDFAIARGLGHALLGASPDAADFESRVEEVIASVEGPDNRFLLRWWLAGNSLKQAAEILGMEEAAVRQRWRRIRTELAARYADPEAL